MDRNHCKLERGLEKQLPVLVLPILQQQDAFFFPTFSTTLCLEKQLLPKNVPASRLVRQRPGYV